MSIALLSSKNYAPFRKIFSQSGHSIGHGCKQCRAVHCSAKITSQMLCTITELWSTAVVEADTTLLSPLQSINSAQLTEGVKGRVQCSRPKVFITYQDICKLPAAFSASASAIIYIYSLRSYL